VSSKTTFIGAVEIGTSKITALVGEYTGREVVIIGCGECSSRGVIKGSVVDYRAATECTHSALEIAEKDANERVDHVYLAQTGGHLEGFYNEASVNVKAADNMIEMEDIRTVCDLAKAKDLPLGRMVVHNIRRPFRVDCRHRPRTSWASASRWATGPSTDRNSGLPTTSMSSAGSTSRSASLCFQAWLRATW
jgi:cell division protein FtsA